MTDNGTDPSRPPHLANPRQHFDNMWSDGCVDAQRLGPLTLVRYRLVRRELAGRICEASRVLDVGCGNGTLLASLSNVVPVKNLIGVELSPEGVRTARSDIKPNLIVGDFLQMIDELAADPFDIVVSSEVLEHVDDPKEVATGFFRVLKPGGTVVITVPAQMRYWSAQDVNAGHQRRFEFDDFDRMMREIGYEVENLFGWGGGPAAQLYNRMISAVGPKRVSKSGSSWIAKVLSPPIRASLRLEDLYKTRRGFQLVCRARKP